ncbi:hypothetical protein BD779DRAFT_1565485 [Infundibulicybe gibba]|nr:hypothetical protein BD779DRAFT_1565485 [Infundibulicybe gibba]
MRSYIYTALLTFAALTSQLGVTSAHGFGGSVRAGIVRDTLENRQAGGGAGLGLAGAAASLAAPSTNLAGVGVAGNGPAAGLPLIGGLLNGLPLVGGLLNGPPVAGGPPQNGETGTGGLLGSLLGGILG